MGKVQRRMAAWQMHPLAVLILRRIDHSPTFNLIYYELIIPSLGTVDLVKNFHKNTYAIDLRLHFGCGFANIFA
jgi:hypothetical protein